LRTLALHDFERFLPAKYRRAVVCQQKAPKKTAQRRQVFGSPCLMQAEIVITYIDHPWGGAAKFAALAEHQGKTVIPLGTV
ncbi:MAG: hypothetical protein II727_08275, partial [Oscillospiraceae bacterium]|nr:hypothetical protein [Oscillospiraceae bacterium]